MVADRPEDAVLEDGQVREEVELLEYHPDPAAHGRDLFRIAVHLPPLEDDGAALVGLQAVHASDQRRLARSGRAADDDPLAGQHVEIDRVQGAELRIPFADVPHHQDRRGVLADGSDQRGTSLARRSR